MATLRTRLIATMITTTLISTSSYSPLKGTFGLSVLQLGTQGLSRCYESESERDERDGPRRSGYETGTSALVSFGTSTARLAVGGGRAIDDWLNSEGETPINPEDNYRHLKLQFFDTRREHDVRILVDIERLVIKALTKYRNCEQGSLQLAIEELLVSENFWIPLFERFEHCEYPTDELSYYFCSLLDRRRNTGELSYAYESYLDREGNIGGCPISFDCENRKYFEYLSKQLLKTIDIARDDDFFKKIEEITEAIKLYSESAATWFDEGWTGTLRCFFDREVPIFSEPLKFSTSQKLLRKEMIGCLHYLIGEFAHYGYGLCVPNFVDISESVSNFPDMVKKFHQENSHIMTEEQKSDLLAAFEKAHSAFKAARFSHDLLKFVTTSNPIPVKKSMRKRARVVLKDTAKGAVAGGVVAGGAALYLTRNPSTAFTAAKYGAAFGAGAGAATGVCHDVKRLEMMQGYRNKLKAQMCFLQMTIAAFNSGVARVNRILSNFVCIREGLPAEMSVKEVIEYLKGLEGQEG